MRIITKTVVGSIVVVEGLLFKERVLVTARAQVSHESFLLTP